MDEFHIIRAARKLLVETPKSVISPRSKADYSAKIKRLIAATVFSENQMQTFAPLIAKALETTKKSTWQSNRAALVYKARAGLEKFLAKQDELQRRNKTLMLVEDSVDLSDWKEEVAKVNQWREALHSILNAKLPTEGRSNRHTKRQDMRGLPDDWREQIISRMPRYQPAVLVAAVTGCRPSELVKGVELSIRDGYLVARIQGAKVDIVGGKGQEWRELSWPIEHENNMVQDLVKRTIEANGCLKVTVTSASNFSNAMSQAAFRIWPHRKAPITPYCMRHQAAADMKSSGELCGTDISAALGHSSDVTKSTYGHSSMGKKGGVSPTGVLAACPVKIIDPSKAAIRMSALITNQSKIIEI